MEAVNVGVDKHPIQRKVLSITSKSLHAEHPVVGIMMKHWRYLLHAAELRGRIGIRCVEPQYCFNTKPIVLETIFRIHVKKNLGELQESHPT